MNLVGKDIYLFPILFFHHLFKAIRSCFNGCSNQNIFIYYIARTTNQIKYKKNEKKARK